jgi:hypothetical protein
MANVGPLIVKVKVVWWLPVYLQTLKTLCEITGMEPNMERVGYWVSKALKTEIVTASRSKQHD